MEQENNKGIIYQSPRASRRPRRRKKISLFLVVLVLCVASGFGGGWLATVFYHDSGMTEPESMVTSDGDTIATADEGLITTVAQRVSESVVSIVTTSNRSLYSNVQGAGTGVVVSEDGYIMTNKHVIDGARRVSVVLADGTEHTDVRLVGSDPLNDIAFIKINDVSGLKPADLGDSSRVRIGQRVVAIGNALGQFQTTVTSGIISGTGRPLVATSMDGRSSESLTDLIQTDAAINSGNSGGPLVDLSGRVIGINTAVAQDANGIGFAIPINATQGILKGVLESGRVTRAYLGVRYIDITPAMAVSEGLEVKRGAYVSTEGSNPIMRGSPADKAGIEAGDIITRVNHEVVGEGSNMSSLIGQYQPGETVTLTVLRDGEELRLEVELAVYTEGSSR